jgi:hypothetical protein
MEYAKIKLDDLISIYFRKKTILGKVCGNQNRKNTLFFECKKDTRSVSS